MKNDVIPTKAIMKRKYIHDIADAGPYCNLDVISFCILVITWLSDLIQKSTTV